MRRIDGGVVRRSKRIGLVLALMGATAGCTRIDRAIGSISWFSTMDRAPSIRPYEMTRPAPAHAVPYLSPAGKELPHFASDVPGLDSLANYVKPPAWMASPTPAQMTRAEGLFDRNCMVCHGPTGHGNGPIIGPKKFLYAPNLMLPITVNRTDGYIYAMIRMGRGLMPAYGERLDNEDRWLVVAYVRKLQQDAASGQEPKTGLPFAGFNGWAAPERGMVNVPQNALVMHPGGQPIAEYQPGLWTGQWAEQGYYYKNLGMPPSIKPVPNLPPQPNFGASSTSNKSAPSTASKPASSTPTTKPNGGR